MLLTYKIWQRTCQARCAQLRVNKIIFTRMTSFHNNSRALYNFVTDSFPASRTVFEIGKLIPQFAARLHCKWSHRITHRHFIIPRHRVYDYNCHRSLVYVFGQDSSYHPVYYTYLHTSRNIFTYLHVITFIQYYRYSITTTFLTNKSN